MRHESANPVTEAVNEAIANALVHAHYGSSASVKVVLGQDGLEVTNTGDFLIDRRVAIAGGFSETRNPTLMRMLSLIGATDRAGSGLQKIWSVWDGLYGEPPLLEETHAPASVRMVLPFDLGSAQELPVIGSRPDDVLAALRNSPNGFTVSDLKAKAMVSERVAQKVLRELFDCGLAVRERDGHQFRYFASR